MSDSNKPDQGLTPAQLFDLDQEIQVNANAIVSKTLRKSATLNLTLFAFDAGQGLSGHSSPMDAYVQILSGKMNITIAENNFTLESDQMILMPAEVPHALEAIEPTRMLLTMTPKAGQ
ncbi:cupin domain-containing protein [bacterium]|nr:cupin domain-containing protein [bacterium]